MNFGLTYANQFTDQVAVGFTASVINEDIHEASARGMVFDFGIQYATPLQGLSLGIVFKNFGPSMRFDGPGFEHSGGLSGNSSDARDKTFRLRSASFELPTFIQFGVAYNVWSDGMNSVTFQPSFRNNSYAGDEYNVGAEYSFQDQFFIRTGFIGSEQDDYIYDMTFGAGVKLSNLSFDYAYGNVSEYFDSTHMYTLKFGF
jgi:hypothetical protein